MYAGNERKRVEVLIKILDVKKHAKSKIEALEYNAKFWDVFPELNAPTRNRIGTLKKVLNRMDIRYYKTLQR